MRACTSEEEDSPDADLASAWLDEESASSVDVADPCFLGPTEAHELFTSGKVTLLDLRTQWQFARERVLGAVNVPAGEPGPSGLLFHFRSEFEDELRTLHPPDAAPLLLICELGVVSQVAANRLLDHGWTDVTVVRGGLEAWRDEALPTEETAAAGGDFSGATEAGEGEEAHLGEGEEAHLGEEAGEPEWWRSAVGQEIPEWTWAEGEEPAMWPVSGPDPLDELTDADDGEGGQFGVGIDELELEDFSLFDEKEAPPPSPLDAAEAAAAGLDELVADLDRPLEEPNKAAPKAKKGAAKKRASAAPVVAPVSEAYAALAGLEPPAAAAAPRASAAASYGGPSRQPRGGNKGGRFRGGLPPAWLVDVTNVDFAALASTGELATLSVKELKSFLYEQEASLSGAKKVLVERVTDILETQGSLEQDGASPAPTDAPPAAAAAAYPAAVNGASNGAAAPEEGADGDEVLSLFDTEAAGADEVLDDSLIDEVFSAM